MPHLVYPDSYQTGDCQEEDCRYGSHGL